MYVPDMLHSIIFLIKIKWQQWKMDTTNFFSLINNLMRQKHEIIIALISILALFWTYHYNIIIKDELIVQHPDDVETESFSCDDIQKSRIKLLQQQCQKLLLASGKEQLGPIKSQFFDDPPNPKMNNVYVNHPRKLSMCIPHKVGSQTWRYFFQQLDRLDQEEEARFSNVENEIVENYTVEKWPDNMEPFFKAYQVRHPLERFLSSYRYIKKICP